MSTRRVFVPSVPTRYDPVSEDRVAAVDLRSAAAYGELVVLAKINSPVYQEDLDSGLLAAVRSGVRAMHPEDYLLALGDPVLIAVAASEAARTLGRVKILRWSKRNSDYDCLEIEL